MLTPRSVVLAGVLTASLAGFAQAQVPIVDDRHPPLGYWRWLDCGCKPAACEQDGDCSQDDQACCSQDSGCGELLQLIPNRGPWYAGGWTQLGYHTSGTNGADIAFNTRPNEVQLQQQWLNLGRVADRSGCGWDWGVRMDYLYGTDGQDLQAGSAGPNSWDTGWDNGGDYGHAIPQLYGELVYNRLSVKVGHFFTYLGYESPAAPYNFFYSRSLTKGIEGITRSGVVAEYALNPNLTLYNGWLAGSDTGFDNSQGNLFMGGFQRVFSERAVLSYIAEIGDIGLGGAGDNNSYTHTVTLSYCVSERLRSVLTNDLFDDQAFIVGTGQRISVGQYVFYKLNDKLALGGRLEWASLAGSETVNVTTGLNWRPHSNFVLRPEVRFEDYDAGFIGTRDSTIFGMDALLVY